MFFLKKEGTLAKLGASLAANSIDKVAIGCIFLWVKRVKWV